MIKAVSRASQSVFSASENVFYASTTLFYVQPPHEVGRLELGKQILFPKTPTFNDGPVVVVEVGVVGR